MLICLANNIVECRIREFRQHRLIFNSIQFVEILKNFPKIAYNYSLKQNISIIIKKLKSIFFHS